LPLHDGATYAENRHYDAKRNPVTVHVVGREKVAVPAGEFETIAVEMYVTDDGRFDGGGVVRFNFSTDRNHIPIRIESSMPGAGTVTLELTEWVMASRQTSPPGAPQPR
jgi:hypothetical protein